MATLLILKGSEQGKRLELKDERIILGRNRDCHVVIDFPAVSREHAQIVRAEGKFFIEDHGSRNGTYVNNQPIKGRTLLQDNDRIKICDFLCMFHDGTAQTTAKPVATTDGDFELADDTSSVVEKSLNRLSSAQIYQAQPAEKLKALLEITANLSKTLELDKLLPRIAESIFQLFRQADRCFLILKESPSGKLVPKMIQTRRPGGEASARFSRSIVEQCITSGQSLLSEDATTDTRFGMSQSVADFRIRSVMCAPLCSAEGKGFGVIQLDTQDRTKKFTEEDLKLIMGVANQAAIALENVQMHEDLVAKERYQRDLELARQVQRGFLPGSAPKLAGYEFFWHYESAYEVGGDYYDFVTLKDGRVAVLLGDVAGKGVPAALLMAKLCAEGRFCMITEPTLPAAVTQLNELLLKAGLEDRFVTLAGAVIDPARHQAQVINAGHMPPLLYKQSANEVQDAVSRANTGLPLGIMDGFQYNAQTITFQPGDCLLLFTDGVTDALDANHVAFQMSGVHAAVTDKGSGGSAGAAQVGERLLQAVKRHSSGKNQHDDIALVCFGRTVASKQ